MCVATQLLFQSSVVINSVIRLQQGQHDNLVPPRNYPIEPPTVIEVEGALCDCVSSVPTIAAEILPTDCLNPAGDAVFRLCFTDGCCVTDCLCLDDWVTRIALDLVNVVNDFLPFLESVNMIGVVEVTFSWFK